MELSQKNLEQLAKLLPCPTYDRSALKAGIVHIGVGGFHRAHQAFYADQLLQESGEKGWAIHGVGLREWDRKMQGVLQQQDGLYTLIVKHPDGTAEPRIIGSITDFSLAVDGGAEVLELMAAPTTKIVSLTITEGGYNFHPVTGAFDFENPDIQEELKNPQQPKTVFGYLTDSLKIRRDRGLLPFTVMSCDNIQHNGDVTRKMLLSFARRQDAGLGDWIAKEVTFPNSMVDRITPVTTPADIDYLKTNHGVADAWPVTCEPFIQWVVEDKFCNGRPAFEKVGVQFVADVMPYEEMKLRLLNAGHSVLGLLGAIHGHPTINACMEDALFAKSLRTFLDREASPTLDEVKGIDLEAYKDSLLERFANPNIKDSVSRICSESSAKLPKFLLPTLQENLKTGGDIQLATLVIAAWCYYSDKGIDKDGQPIDIIDAMSADLHVAAKGTKNDPLSFIRQESLFGDLAENARFAELYAEKVREIYADPDIREDMKNIY